VNPGFSEDEEKTMKCCLPISVWESEVSW